MQSESSPSIEVVVTVHSLTAFVLILAFSLAPALAFLGLWKCLEYLRDDALVTELQTVHGFDLSTGVGLAAFVPSRRSSSATSTLVSCPACTEPIVAGEPCHSCGSQLEGDSHARCEERSSSRPVSARKGTDSAE
ncbi:hypothetical protein [Natronobeatus ordinarius]|uniref:hypothetical protein n=1 Tax=Natronobeatus ordinarius TaxID=2963433 RepID=UPI0020CE15AA|nr:hypothetical protein [Natronobeatus ordinarius]